jgi:hypothetical protein
MIPKHSAVAGPARVSHRAENAGKPHLFMEHDAILDLVEGMAG